MDTSRLDEQAKKDYDALMRAVEQGEKIERLLLQPEWEFWEGWIRASWEEYRRQTSETTQFVKDHDGYLLTLGRSLCFKEQLDAIEQFRKNGKEAREKLAKWQKELQDEL